MVKVFDGSDFPLIDAPEPDAPREEHERFANERGFFWLPCPICGEPFGGHETVRGGILWKTEYSGEMTCPKCPGEFV